MSACPTISRPGFFSARMARPDLAGSTTTVTLGSYGRLCTEFYDLDKPEPPLAELERYARYAARAEGPVHEAMCGSGRFLLPSWPAASISTDRLVAADAGRLPDTRDGARSRPGALRATPPDPRTPAPVSPHPDPRRLVLAPDGSGPCSSRPRSASRPARPRRHPAARSHALPGAADVDRHGR